MRTKACLTLAASIALLTVLGIGDTASGVETSAEEKCRAAKLRALAKRDACVRLQQRKDVLGKPGDEASCRVAFEATLARVDRRAAQRGASCRWLEHEDGTATDLDTGLQWELKTDDGTIHDKDHEYTWSATGTAPDGTVFVVFLGTLNAGSRLGSKPTGCFADKCDWRLPTYEELLGILDTDVPGCGEPPWSGCTTIPGLTGFGFHWSKTDWRTFPNLAWTIDFGSGIADGLGFRSAKAFENHVRAVRGGS